MTTAKTTKTRAKAKLADDVQSKAKAVYEKGASTVGEVTGFAKGNVDAVVESGKILGAGLKELGETYVAEGRSAFVKASADVKELTAVKSPVEFMKVQSDIFSRNLGAAVDFNTRSAKAMLKLAKDSVAPLSGRVSLAVAKVRTAA